jgi:hypothetical protein
MNFLDAAGVLADSAELLINDAMAHEARQVVRDVVAAYDALAPDWTLAPDGATHYVINAEGYAEWLFGVESKHQVAIIGTKWSKRYVWSTEPVGHIDLPLGLDWRLCIWERSEAQP